MAGGVIPIPSADADAAASYWASKLTSGSPAATAQSAGATAPTGATSTASPEPDAAPMSVSDPLSGSPYAGASQVGALFGTANGSISGQRSARGCTKLP